MLIKDLAARFLDWCTERTKKTTVDFYRQRLSRFVAEFGEREIAALTKPEVLAYLDQAARKPDGSSWAPDTIRGNAIAFDRLQAYAVEQELLPRKIVDKIRKPGGRRRTLLPTPEETAKLLEHASPEFRLIYRALRLTGARPNELARARIEDIDQRAGEIILHEHKTAGKTGEPRRIAIGHPTLQEILAEAIGGRTEGPIFRTKTGKAWTVYNLSDQYRTARKAAGLPVGLVLYLARHEHGTMIYKATGDIKATADALGHKQISTTMRYTRVDGDSLKKHQQLFDERLPPPEDRRAA